MDQDLKAFLEELFGILKQFLDLIGLGEKFDALDKEIGDILGAEAE